MKSKPNKEFGRGFYLSADYEQALNMAQIKTEQLQEGEPIVMEYDVDEIEMQKLQITASINVFFSSVIASLL